MDTHTFCHLDKYILQSRPKMEEVCTPPLPNQNWACILFRQIHFAEIYFKFWKNTFCNLDQTKCGGGVPSTTAQWELSSAPAGGVPHSHNMLLLRYLVFLICLSGGCLLRMPKSTYLKWLLCFFKPIWGEQLNICRSARSAAAAANLWSTRVTLTVKVYNHLWPCWLLQVLFRLPS